MYSKYYLPVLLHVSVSPREHCVAMGMGGRPPIALEGGDLDVGCRSEGGRPGPAQCVILHVHSMLISCV